MGKYLYTWHWSTGGGNQVWADTEEQAIESAKAVSSRLCLVYPIAVTNLRRVGERGDKAVDRYFDSISRD